MGVFSHLSVRTKLLASFVIVCVITGVVGAVGINQLSQVNTMLGNMYDKEVQGSAQSLQIAWNVAQIGRDARQAILDTDLEAIRKLKVDIETRSKDVQASFVTVEDCFVTSEGKALVRKASEQYVPFLEKINASVDFSLQEKDEQARAAVVESRVFAKELAGTLNEMVELKQKNAAAADTAGDERYATARLLMLGFVIGGILIGLTLGIIIARAITQPLMQAVGVLQAVAKGDLTARLNNDSKDEVGQMATALNQAVDSMRDALTEVRSVADGVASASQQLAASSQQISTGAQEQASSLEETASSLEEITATIKQNADNADQANQLSARSREVAEKGGKVVGDAVNSMQEINASSKKIADIITAIDEIAFQTNLLALNAAVEAARAGEQGRGFAVVAGEVRNLAQRSAGAAKEIKSLIQDSVRKVEIGSQLVNQSGQTLEEIVTAVKRVTDIVAEISAASREQATGIEQVNRAVAQMDHVTQENASQTEELSGTAEGLSGQAEGLQDLVARFRLSETNERSPAANQRRSPSTSRSLSAAPKKTPSTLTAKRPGATTCKPAKPQHSSHPSDRHSSTHELDQELVGASAAKSAPEGFEEF
ncbi:MAG TPA: methyl-accepting chemotaxis protein [Pirellulaceae bacterium]|nr:methyl-accepting chemotaxis protein [Pirellulaceae bacterium]